MHSILGYIAAIGNEEQVRGLGKMLFKVKINLFCERKWPIYCRISLWNRIFHHRIPCEAYCSYACTGSCQFVSLSGSCSLCIIFKHFPLCKQNPSATETNCLISRLFSSPTPARWSFHSAVKICHLFCEIHFLLLSYLLPSSLPSCFLFCLSLCISSYTAALYVEAYITLHAHMVNIITWSSFKTLILFIHSSRQTESSNATLNDVSL